MKKQILFSFLKLSYLTVFPRQHFGMERLTTLAVEVDAGMTVLQLW